jgi:hypothetical protein
MAVAMLRDLKYAVGALLGKVRRVARQQEPLLDFPSYLSPVLGAAARRWD